MAVHLRIRKTKSGGTYFLDIDLGGKRWYEPLNLKYENKDLRTERANIELQARAQRSKREIELVEGPAIKKKLLNICFLDFFQSRIDNYSGKNKGRLRAILAAFKAFHPHNIVPIGSLNKLLIKDFRHYLGENFNASTPNDYFQKFRSILNEAVEAGYIDKNPCNGVRNPNPSANTLRKDVLFDDEIILLSQTPIDNLELRRAALYSCMTGLGLAEIKSLKWSDIDYQNKIMKIFRKKTGEPQIVPLNDNAMKLLGFQGKQDAKVFNLKISTNGVNKSIGRWVKRAGIEKHITFYSFRHSFITNVLFHTSNLKLASALAGHTTTRHTERYVHLIDSQKRDAVNKLPDIFNLNS